MSNQGGSKLTRASALRLEFSVIGLGILALFMIFQPFSLIVFSFGCGFVVLAALANNLLPLAEPGTPVRTIYFAAAVVALISAPPCWWQLQQRIYTAWHFLKLRPSPWYQERPRRHFGSNHWSGGWQSST